MFHVLIESNATPRPAIGGSIASAIGHALLVGGVVALTAEVGERVISPPEPRARFIPVAPVLPPPRPSPARPAAARSEVFAEPAALGVPALPTVVDIRVGLPPIDLSRTPSDASDFLSTTSRTGRADGSRSGIGSGDGASVLQEHQVDKPVILMPGSRAPVYPESLRAAGLSGNVTLEFVVDTLGRVETGSAHVIEGDHPLFSASALRALGAYRFLPAEAGGQRVRQLVRLPFRFAVSP